MQPINFLDMLFIILDRFSTDLKKNKKTENQHD